MKFLRKRPPQNIEIYHIDYEEYKHRIKWLYKGRIITIFPCVITYFILAYFGKFLPDLTWLYVIIAFESLCNAPYEFVIKKFYTAKKEDLLILLLLGIDVIATTLALHIVGLQDALFFGAIYLVTITFAGILSTQKVAYIISTFSALCYSALTFLEYNGYIPHISTIGIKLTAWQSAAWAISHVLFFYITAYLTNFYSNPIKLWGRKLYLWSKTLEDRLHKSHIEAIKALLNALKVKDPYTESHSYNVAWYSTLMANVIGLPESELNDIRDACFLHDIGKIGIEDSILTKKDKLTPQEWEKIRLHPEFGSEIIAALSGIENVSKMIIQEHEHYDGSGYPKGLKGSEICLGSQIIAIADAFDVLVSGRPYKKPIPPDEAIEIIMAQKGMYFAPEVADRFHKIYMENKEKILSFINQHENENYLAT